MSLVDCIVYKIQIILQVIYVQHQVLKRTFIRNLLMMHWVNQVIQCDHAVQLVFRLARAVNTTQNNNGCESSHDRSQTMTDVEIHDIISGQKCKQDEKTTTTGGTHTQQSSWLVSRSWYSSNTVTNDVEGGSNDHNNSKHHKDIIMEAMNERKINELLTDMATIEPDNPNE